MDSGKPNIFDGLTTNRRHKILSKSRTPLVDRHAMADMRHFGVMCRMRKAAEVINHADRADRVPNSDEVDRTRPCQCSLKFRTGLSARTRGSKIALPVNYRVR